MGIKIFVTANDIDSGRQQTYSFNYGEPLFDNFVRAAHDYWDNTNPPSADYFELNIDGQLVYGEDLAHCFGHADKNLSLRALWQQFQPDNASDNAILSPHPVNLGGIHAKCGGKRAQI